MTDETDMGFFKCVSGNRSGTWIVKSSAGVEDLFLASPAAKQAFLKAIVDRFVGDDDDDDDDDDEMDMEAWYFYNRAMEKDKD